MVSKISSEQLLTSLLRQRVQKDENNGEKININYFDEFFFQKVSLKEIKKLFETLNAALPDEAQLKRLGEKMVLEYRANVRITQDPLDVLTKDNDKTWLTLEKEVFHQTFCDFWEKWLSAKLSKYYQTQI